MKTTAPSPINAAARQVPASTLRRASVSGPSNSSGWLPARFGQVMQLKVGDIVPLEIPKTVTPMINGMPIMECQYGIFNRQYSLRVVRMIDNGPHDAVHQSASNE